MVVTISRYGEPVIRRRSNRLSHPRRRPNCAIGLLAELNNLGSADDAAMWSHRSLGEKNRLTPPDAQRVEQAFQKQLERGRSQRVYDIATGNRPSHGIHPPELSRNQKHGLASIGDRFHGSRPLCPACRA